MSVAFRRDSDEEHREPRFEIPLPPGPNLVTARGLVHTQDRVADLEARIAERPDHPGLEELKRDLRYWRTRLATAELAPAPSGQEVAFGCRVRFRLNGTERTVDVVGDDEADPAEAKLAFSAPVVRAMIGSQAGDVVGFGGEIDAIEVLAIARIHALEEGGEGPED